MKAQRHVPRALCLVASSAFVAMSSVGCLTQRSLDKPPPGHVEEPAHLELRREKDIETGQLVHEWTMLVRRGAHGVRSGPDKTWYRSGAKQWERAYDHGEPAGTWRKWYENGQQESETIFAGRSVETTMRFWHANGTHAAEGPAKNGERSGMWRFWREDGELAEEGAYVNSLREGAWRILDEDGTSTKTVTYARNVRIVGAAKP